MHANSKRSTHRNSQREKGAAILVAVFALLLLTAAAIALIYSTNTETGVNWNYRQESIAYFAARAGIEEARDRMASSGLGGEITPLPTLPPDAGCGSANCAVIYVLNKGGDSAAPQPTSATISGQTNNYFDDQFCHDYAGFGSNFFTAPGVRCTAYPTGFTVTTVQTDSQWNPYANNAAALPYKWARIAVKENGSVEYGDPTSQASQSYYLVDPSQNTTAGMEKPVCFDGNNERVPPAGVATCAAWAAQPTPIYANPVYTITAMAVAPSGARKVVQQEVALAPVAPFPYGLWGTSPSCNAVQFQGNNEGTDSYNSAAGPYGGNNKGTQGDVGSMGGVNVGNGDIGGLVGVLLPPPNGPGTCATPFTIANNGTDCFTNAGSQNCSSQQATYLPNPYTFTTPPAPNPPTLNTSTTPPSCGGGGGGGKGKGGGGGSGLCLPPGTYGNISLSGSNALTLTPGVYNINSLSMSGNAVINISGSGQVVINVGGTGCDTGCNGLAAGQVMSLTGNGINNGGGTANQMLINYAGTDSIDLGGNGQSTAVIDAPNSNLSLQGGGNSGQWFGSIVASTITITGNMMFHYDTASAQQPQNNQNYTTLAFREVAY